MTSVDPKAIIYFPVAEIETRCQFTYSSKGFPGIKSGGNPVPGLEIQVEPLFDENIILSVINITI